MGAPFQSSRTLLRNIETSMGVHVKKMILRAMLVLAYPLASPPALAEAPSPGRLVDYCPANELLDLFFVQCPTPTLGECKRLIDYVRAHGLYEEDWEPVSALCLVVTSKGGKRLYVANFQAL